MSVFRICTLLAVGILGLLSCGLNPEESSPPAPTMPLQLLNAARDTVVVNGVEYCATISPWRDFMPGPNTSLDGKGLLVHTSLQRCDSLSIPENLHLKFLWVIYNNEVWGAVLGEESTPYNADFRREAMARGGPKWGPSVDVRGVIGFADEHGEFHMVCTPPIMIGRTD